MINRYGWQFYHWHIEPSSKCTVKCPRCPRTEFPNTSWLQKELSLEEFKNAFTPSFISEYVQRFTMCGDVGDPIYCKDYLRIVEYIKSINLLAMFILLPMVVTRKKIGGMNLHK